MITNKSTGNKINIANILTIFRMLLIFPAVLFVFTLLPFHLIYAFFIFVLAAYTDYLDGKIAREYGHITDFGKIMDPLADKLMVISVLVSFCVLNFCPWLPVILIAVRETLITIVRFFILKNDKKVIAANKWGKFKTLSQITVVCFIFLFNILNESIFLPQNIFIFLNSVSTVLLWLSVIFSWISAFIYLKEI